MRTASAMTSLLNVSGGGGAGGGACNAARGSGAGVLRAALGGAEASFDLVPAELPATLAADDAVRAGGVVLALCTAVGGIAPLRCAAGFAFERGRGCSI